MLPLVMPILPRNETVTVRVSEFKTGATVDVELGSVAGIVAELPPQAANNPRPTMEIRGAALENNFISGNFLIPGPGQWVHVSMRFVGIRSKRVLKSGWQ